MATSIGQYTPVFLPGEPLWDREVYRVAKSPLHQWELSKKLAQLLGLQGPWQLKVCRATHCLCPRSYSPIWVFFWTSCRWWSEGLFGQSFSVALPFSHLEGSLAWSPSLLFGTSGKIKAPLAGALLCRSACQMLKGGHPGWGPTV